MAWMIGTLIALASGTVGAVLGARWMFHRDEAQLAAAKALVGDYLVERDAARVQGDRNAVHHLNLRTALINEFQAVLTKTELGYLAQLNERDEALVAMRLQLDEALKPRRRSKGQPVSAEVAD